MNIVSFSNMIFYLLLIFTWTFINDNQFSI